MHKFFANFHFGSILFSLIHLCLSSHPLVNQDRKSSFIVDALNDYCDDRAQLLQHFGVMMSMEFWEKKSENGLKRLFVGSICLSFRPCRSLQ